MLFVNVNIVALFTTVLSSGVGRVSRVSIMVRVRVCVK